MTFDQVDQGLPLGCFQDDGGCMNESTYSPIEISRVHTGSVIV